MYVKIMIHLITINIHYFIEKRTLKSFLFITTRKIFIYLILFTNFYEIQQNSQVFSLVRQEIHCLFYQEDESIDEKINKILRDATRSLSLITRFFQSLKINISHLVICFTKFTFCFVNIYKI